MRAGVRVFAVTDHDTVAALPAVAAAAAAAGLGWVPGIEITAVEDGRDVHVLGYGFDPASLDLLAFLQAQRASRLQRIREFGTRFAELGLPIDVEALLSDAAARGGRSVGRAHISRLLVQAGHVASVDEAFTEWLAPGRPGFVARRGAPVAEVVAQIGAAGGLASLAHPGLIGDDGLVARVIGSGFLALEAYHSDHDPQTTAHYVCWSAREGLAVSGGSDYHGESSKRKGQRPGDVELPAEAYRHLRQRAKSTGCAWSWPELPDDTCPRPWIPG